RYEGLEDEMITAIQEAYYLKAKNPSDASVLIACAKQIGMDEKKFEEDLINGTLPHYSFYTPNLINNGHSLPDGSFVDNTFYRDLGGDTAQIDQVATFLQHFLGEDPVSKFPPETLIVLTFDEAYPYQYDYGIYTLLIADFLQAGTVNSEPVNHFNLLASVEDNFGIGNMKRNDAIARPYWFLR
ncbi:MAG: alkaline phosphatase family protein, partial [Chitinophagales bacterium]